MLYFFVQVLSTTLYPDLGCDTSSVWNFCAFSSDVVSWGNKWWHHESAGCFLIAPCKGTQDSFGFWIPRCGFRNPGTKCQSLSVELGFQIPVVSGIPDTLRCIPDFKAQDSGFHKQNVKYKDKFPGFQIRIPLRGTILRLFTCIIPFCQVSLKERETAERAYLKKYAKCWINAGGNTADGQASSLNPAFVELHPRYEELIKGTTS